MKAKIQTATPHGACSYYRTLGPLQRISGLQIESGLEFDWHTLNGADFVFMERPFQSGHLLAAHYTKDFGLKLWVDYDDYFFDVPDWNPNKAAFDDPNTQKAIINTIEKADIVTVTTEAIKDAFLKYNKNVQIIPNAHNDYNYPFEYNFSETKNILWRGSATHRGDLLEYLKEMVESSNAFPDWTWHFISRDIWYVTDYIKNKKLHPELNIIQYFSRLKEIQPSIYIVPLYFNFFNECKSNCGWLEATYAGAVTLAPNMPEWERPGVVLYSSRREFNEKLQMLMSDSDKRRRNHKASYEYIKANLLLSGVNKQREKIIEELCGRTI